MRSDVAHFKAYVSPRPYHGQGSAGTQAGTLLTGTVAAVTETGGYHVPSGGSSHHAWLSLALVSFSAA